MNVVATVDLEMYRGDDKEFPFGLWVDENGTRRALTPAELTGSEIRFTVKRSKRDDDADAVMGLVSPTHITLDTAMSKCTVKVRPTNTESVDTLGEVFEWDLQLKSGSKIHTMLAGRFRVHGDVTRTV